MVLYSHESDTFYFMECLQNNSDWAFKKLLEWHSLQGDKNGILKIFKIISYFYSVQRIQCHYYKNWKNPMSQMKIQLFVNSSVQSLSRVRLFATPWVAACQASLSIINSWSLLKLLSIESVMPSSHLILHRPLLHLPPIPPSIRVFSNESTLCMRWPKYWSFSFSISPSNEHPGLMSFRIDWLDLLAVQGISRVFSNTTVQKHQFFHAQLSSQSNSHIHTWPLEKP